MTEYVLSTLDKVTNWARQGSMWPMTFGERGLSVNLTVPEFNKGYRSCLLRRRDDAYGRCSI
jgi:hypothetical protein